jgi:hypothetical protein
MHGNARYVNPGISPLDPGLEAAPIAHREERAGYLSHRAGSRHYEKPKRAEEENTPMAPLETTTPETGDITGTKDKDYNIIWFTEQCLSNALRLEVYIQDAERENDSELVEFFRKAQHESQKGAEQGKELLKGRL